jgi:hypothetical protein
MSLLCSNERTNYRVKNKARRKLSVERRNSGAPFERGVRQICEMKSYGRFDFVGPALPETLKASTWFAAAQGDEGICTFYRQARAYLFPGGCGSWMRRKSNQNYQLLTKKSFW